MSLELPHVVVRVGITTPTRFRSDFSLQTAGVQRTTHNIDVRTVLLTSLRRRIKCVKSRGKHLYSSLSLEMSPSRENRQPVPSDVPFQRHATNNGSSRSASPRCPSHTSLSPPPRPLAPTPVGDPRLVARDLPHQSSTWLEGRQDAGR